MEPALGSVAVRSPARPRRASDRDRPPPRASMAFSAAPTRSSSPAEPSRASTCSSGRSRTLAIPWQWSRRLTRERSPWPGSRACASSSCRGPGRGRSGGPPGIEAQARLPDARAAEPDRRHHGGQAPRRDRLSRRGERRAPGRGRLRGARVGHLTPSRSGFRSRRCWLGTLSKDLVPGFRIGWIAGPGRIVETAGARQEDRRLPDSAAAPGRRRGVPAGGGGPQGPARPGVRRGGQAASARVRVLEHHLPEITWMGGEIGEPALLDQPAAGVSGRRVAEAAAARGVGVAAGSDFDPRGEDRPTSVSRSRGWTRGTWTRESASSPRRCGDVVIGSQRRPRDAGGVREESGG